jgi:hypothetical protein
MISMLAELETGIKYVMPAEKKPVPGIIYVYLVVFSFNGTNG